MVTNINIITKRFRVLPEEIELATTEVAVSTILEMLDEARTEGYKEGKKYAARHIKNELEKEGYGLMKTIGDMREGHKDKYLESWKSYWKKWLL